MVSLMVQMSATRLGNHRLHGDVIFHQNAARELHPANRLLPFWGTCESEPNEHLLVPIVVSRPCWRTMSGFHVRIIHHTLLMPHPASCINKRFGTRPRMLAL